MDINCDLGESFGIWKLAEDEAIMKLITTANVAAGFHASDPDMMDHTIASAMDAGVQLCAHPGYPDLQGFGRRPMEISPPSLANLLIYQLGALDALAKARGGSICGVKLHGALYHKAMSDPLTAKATVEAVRSYRKDLYLVGMHGSALHEAALQAEMAYACEAFVDRAYHADGRLVSRQTPGGVVTDPQLCLQRALQMVREGFVNSMEGKPVPIKVDTFCVHSDTPGIIEILKSLVDGFITHGITPAPWKAR